MRRVNFRFGAAVAAALLALLGIALPGCAEGAGAGRRHPSVSQVEPPDGPRIDQTATYPEREKIVLKKPPAR